MTSITVATEPAYTVEVGPGALAQVGALVADRRRVANMSVSKTVQTRRDQCACPLILQPRPPSPKLLRLLQFEHLPM